MYIKYVYINLLKKERRKLYIYKYKQGGASIPCLEP